MTLPIPTRRPRGAVPTTVRGAAILCCAVAALALVGAMTLLGAAGMAHAATGGATRYGACLAAQKSGDLLVLVDESSSLQQTDAAAARVAAAQYLVTTLGRYADRVHADLHVAIAGFADDYAVHQDWTPLSGATADAVSARLAALSSDNTGIDTDYWLALDGARQTLAARGTGPGGADRCQAIAWFSDGKIDYTARPLVKPYAEPVSLDAPDGVAETTRRATESICRGGGLADQLRTRGIVMLGVGLAPDRSDGDFDIMSAIATGAGPDGAACGTRTDPTPGDFYPVSGIDEMLFAFDALNPDPGVTQQGPVCALQVCEEARHDFVLDRSITAVSILGSGGQPGVVPYLISPSGQRLQLSPAQGAVDTQIAGAPVHYEWRSQSAQTITLRSGGTGDWPGKWAIVYVDTTGAHPDAVSKVSIHITTDIYPALRDAAALTWRSGTVVRGLTFGLADGRGTTVPPDALAGTATLSAALVPDGAAPIPLLVSVPKTDIAKPVDADLGSVKPGRAVLRMTLVITTAALTGPAGRPGTPGTQLSPQDIEVPLQILPREGLPVPGARLDFGEVQGAGGATATLPVTGPGCVWIAPADAPVVATAPDGIGATHVSSPAADPQTCRSVPAGQTVDLPVTLRTDHDGCGGLNGTLAVHVAAAGNPADTQVVDVAFTASLTKPISTTNFMLVLLAALLAGPGIPLALLYLAKWWTARIPPTPLLAERIPVTVDGERLLRDGEPFALADTDLLHPVPGLAAPARRLDAAGVTLHTITGRSPVGAPAVRVTAEGLLGVGSPPPGADASGLRAVLPLAVHNTWVVLHDPAGPATAAQLLLLVGGRTDTAARRRLYDDVARRAPGLLAGLRLRAAKAGLTPPPDPAAPPSPFGGPTPGAAQRDPFAGPAPAAAQQDPLTAPAPVAAHHESLGIAAPVGAQPHPFGTPPGVPPTPARPGRFDPHPFDPFEGAS